MALAPLIIIGATGIAAALAVGIPPPAPNLWPIAIGFISAGACGLMSTIVWGHVQLRRLRAEENSREVTS